MVVFATETTLPVGGVTLALVALAATVVPPAVTWWLAHLTKKQDWARQDAVAKQAAVAAQLLLAANERVAAGTGEVKNQLGVIHDLVNNEKTRGMQGQLDEMKRGLISLKEIVALNQKLGHQPSEDSLGEIKSTEDRIAKLQAEILEREQQQDKANKPKSTQ